MERSRCHLKFEDKTFSICLPWPPPRLACNRNGEKFYDLETPKLVARNIHFLLLTADSFLKTFLSV